MSNHTESLVHTWNKLVEQAEEMEPLFHNLLHQFVLETVYPCCNGSTIREILALLACKYFKIYIYIYTVLFFLTNLIDVTTFYAISMKYETITLSLA
jgi:hypothetical protein